MNVEHHVMTGLPCIGSGLIDALRRHAVERPLAEAVGELSEAKAICTYGDFAREVAAKARRLSDNVRPGERVISVLPAGVDFIAWFCAAIASGVHILPMHIQVAGPEALAIARRVGAVAAIVSPGLAAETALEHLSLKHRGNVLRKGGTCCVQVNYPGAVVLGSSGTTGLPKLVLRESKSLDADADGVIQGMKLTEGDRVVFVTPMSHSYGIDMLVATLTAGACLRVMARFDAEELAQEIEEGATVLPGVPFVFEALARRPRRCATSLRLALSAGSPLLESVRQDFVDAWGVDIGQLFGATELGTVAIGVPGTEGFGAGSVGRPLAGVSVRVVDAEDPERILNVGQEGQLAVYAPSMLSKYLDAPLSLVDGHLLTGDLAKIDAEGRVWITGRLNLLIDVGAYKVNPLEVESVLGTHPSVAECLVVPVGASETTVQRLRAVVVLRETEPTVTPEALRTFLRERLSPIKVPRVVDLVDHLPKSPTGKVLRGYLMGERA